MGVIMNSEEYLKKAQQNYEIRKIEIEKSRVQVEKVFTEYKGILDDFSESVKTWAGNQ